MKVIYCKYWDRIDKEARNQITEDEAHQCFDTAEHFFVVIYTGNSEIPTHFIEFFSKDSFYVNVLDNYLSETQSFFYDRIEGCEGIDPTRLFASRIIIREMLDKDTQIRGTALNPVLFINGNWEFQENMYCEENNFINNQSSQYYSENKVDINSLYKDIPTFGDWEPVIFNNEPKILDE